MEVCAAARCERFAVKMTTERSGRSAPEAAVSHHLLEETGQNLLIQQESAGWEVQHCKDHHTFVSSCPGPSRPRPQAGLLLAKTKRPIKSDAFI